MHISPDEAKSDAILAGAVTVVGGIVFTIAEGLPLYPRVGMPRMIIDVARAFILTGLVPLLLVRYRGDGLAAFGLGGSRDRWRSGLLLVVPVLALLLLGQPLAGGSLGVLLGPLGPWTIAGGIETSTDLPLTLLRVAEFVLLGVGTLMLLTFLSVRGREGFRAVDLAATQTLRTVGLGAAGAALVGGLLRSFGDTGPSPLVVVLQVVALVALVLLADRLIPLGPTFPRGAIVAPVVVVLAAHVLASGGIIFGNPLIWLHTGGLGVGTTVVVAVLVASRRWAWAIVPLLVAVSWWPTCLRPLPLGMGSLPGC